MFSVCIIDQDLAFTTQLENELIKMDIFTDITVINDSEKGSCFLQKNIPDVLILNHIMPIKDGFDLVREISYSPIHQKMNIFFLTSFPSKCVLTMASRYNFSYLFTKPIDFSFLLETIHNVMNNFPLNSFPLIGKSTEHEVIKLLHAIETPVHTKGYLYLKEAILLSCFHHQTALSLTKDIYPKIAEKFQTTTSCTERAIRHTIKLTWDKKNKKLFHLFSHPLTKKPTNGQLISTISEKIRVL